MADQPKHTLIEDLEAIRKSLDAIGSKAPHIPTLEEIVGHSAPTTVNPSNPFLSSTSLSELIKIRNEAEARAAEELARVDPIKSVEEILTDNEPVEEEEPEEEEPVIFAPDPNIIIEKMESLFDSWIENSITIYLEVFEAEIRNRLKLDFKRLVSDWYKENDLPIPEQFQQTLEPIDEDDEASII